MRYEALSLQTFRVCRLLRNIKYNLSPDLGSASAIMLTAKSQTLSSQHHTGHPLVNQILTNCILKYLIHVSRLDF